MFKFWNEMLIRFLIAYWNDCSFATNIARVCLQLFHGWSRSAVSQAIPNIWRNFTVHHRVKISTPTVPILRQINPKHDLLYFVLKIHFNIISHLCVGLTTGLCSPHFLTKTLFSFSFSPIRVTFPAHFILLDLITRIWWPAQTMTLCTVYFSPSPVTSSLLCQSNFLSILSSNTLRLCCPP